MGIIGIIAEMTIPILVQNVQKQISLNLLKETFSSLSQAVIISRGNNGEIQSWPEWDTDEKTFADNLVLPYLKVSRNCGYDYGGSNTCWSAHPKLLNGNDYTGGFTYYYVTLNNGVAVAFGFDSNTRINILVDLNGMDKPNVFGKDIFLMEINKNLNKGITFYGDVSKANGRNYMLTCSYGGCSKSTSVTDAGIYCGELIYIDGWQIKDDYPW